jgi:2-amino-4-hydroxy-6-hydroxymethyldihydropteridine diphosphokinase
VALGSNLGDRKAQLLRAVVSWSRLPQVRLDAVSSLWETAPQGPCVAQPPFLNAVLRLQTTLSPDALFRRGVVMEQAAGRQRQVPGGPRTLDVDLLLYGQRTIRTPELTVPHPRMGQRAFVLCPLWEVADEALRRDLPSWRQLEELAVAQRAVVAAPAGWLATALGAGVG